MVQTSRPSSVQEFPGDYASPAQLNPADAANMYAPDMPYVDQFDHLQPIGDDRHTHTIVVFTDGLVVSPARHLFLPPSVGVGQRDRDGHGYRATRLRREAQAMGDDASAYVFAQTRRKTLAIPYSMIKQVVLSQPGRRRRLAIYEETANPSRPAITRYVCDLSADRVRTALGPLLGRRLIIEVQD
jgi:hypothetical protein